MHDAHEVSSGGSAIGIAALRLGILALPMATGDASVRHVRQRGLRQARQRGDEGGGGVLLQVLKSVLGVFLSRCAMSCTSDMSRYRQIE